MLPRDLDSYRCIGFVLFMRMKLCSFSLGSVITLLVRLLSLITLNIMWTMLAFLLLGMARDIGSFPSTSNNVRGSDWVEA